MKTGRSSVLQSLSRPAVLGTLLFVAAIGVAGALAYQAIRSARSHREAAEATLVHHSRTVAWRFARDARSWIGYGMQEAADALQREVGQASVMPGPDLLRRVLALKECDCMSAGFARTFVRVLPQPEAPLDLTGEPLSQRSRDDLRTRLLAFAADTQSKPGMRQWRIFPPGTPRLNRETDVVLVWRVGDRQRGVRGVYAMVVDSGQIARPLRGARDQVQFFPPSMISAAAADSLVRVEVVGENRVPLFSVGPRVLEFVGTDTLGSSFGDMIALAAINPAAAQMLIVGGLPKSRAPFVVALLALVVAMGAAAVLLIRREHKLALLREDFVSGVSHELRTPLTHIRMLSELLEREGFKSAPERERAVGVIHRESLRLTNLVDNILEFARLRRAPTIPSTARVSVADVLHEVADALSPLLEARGSRLEIVNGDGAEIIGDRDAVSRVLRNLVENASKYGPPAQTIRMTSARIESARVVRVTVDDEGPGIPVGERERIWQPYYRLDRDRNAPAGGSGLGLAVVADLVRMLGGTVSVGDAPGRGARFTVEFPVVA